VTLPSPPGKPPHRLAPRHRNRTQVPDRTRHVPTRGLPDGGPPARPPRAEPQAGTLRLSRSNGQEQLIQPAAIRPHRHHVAHGHHALVDRIEARFEAHGYGLWALEVRETGQFIGFTGLAPMQDDVPGAGGTEIGWRLARPAWHQGYATEAALAARDVAFSGAGLTELWSMTGVLNTPSQAVMCRIGMTEATRFEHPRIPDGSPLKPHVVYQLASPEPMS
jgi:RimJ/RimL family protein N-acetyltransferase